MKVFWAICYWVLVIVSLQAEIKLPAIFSDNMVLQSGEKVPFWGRASPEEKITVKFDNQSKTTVADKSGKWQVKVGPFKPGINGELKVQGKNTVIIKNVLTGEVWLCSGQSNMRFAVNGLKEKNEISARPEEKEIRFFKVKSIGSANPVGDVSGKWEICNKSSLHSMSAVGYYFAYDLNKSKKVPVGVIMSALAGSLIQAWTPLSALATDKKMKKYFDKYHELQSHVLTPQEYHKASTGYWTDQRTLRKLIKDHKKETGKAIPRDQENKFFEKQTGRLHTPAIKADLRYTPTLLYNGMIAGIQPYAIRGILWYQGESNGWMGPIYADQMVIMINSWRKGWQNSSLPFLFVQLPGYKKKATQPGPSPWSILREAQSKVNSAVPNTGMACIIDIGEENDIHPKNKKTVADRLLKIAKAKCYGDKNLVYSGPIMKEVVFVDDKAIVSFDHIHDGLVDNNGGELKGFSIAGKDKKFIWAKAKINGTKVEVWNNQIKEPVAIRYAWSMFPDFDLFNKNGLPAQPFRSEK